VTVRAKIFLQGIWQAMLTWDDPLHKEIIDTCFTILSDLIKLLIVLVPTAYFLSSDTSPYQLYVPAPRPMVQLVLLVNPM